MDRAMFTESCFWRSTGETGSWGNCWGTFSSWWSLSRCNPLLSFQCPPALSDDPRTLSGQI